jgi:hypothetical protein
MSALIGRLSYANVIATLALFIALGGVGYAATKLPKNSVRTKQLANNSVTSPKVKDGTLGRSDLAPGVIPNAVDTSNFYNKNAADSRFLDKGTADSRFYDKGASDARFLGINATADNAQALGSFPASTFPITVHDDGQVAEGAYPRIAFARRSLAAGTGTTTILAIGLLGGIRVSCSDPATPSISYLNFQQSPQDVLTQNMISGGLSYASVGSEAASPTVEGSGAVKGPSRFNFIVGSGTSAGDGIVAVFDVTTVTAPGGVSDNSCLVQVQSQAFITG